MKCNFPIDNKYNVVLSDVIYSTVLDMSGVVYLEGVSGSFDMTASSLAVCFCEQQSKLFYTSRITECRATSDHLFYMCKNLLKYEA